MCPEDTCDIPSENKLTLNNIIGSADANDTCDKVHKRKKVT